MLRKGPKDWRSRLLGDIATARGFRDILTTPIRCTPFVENGYRAIRFEGGLDLGKIFAGTVVTKVASPTGAALLGLTGKPQKIRWMLPLAA